jgi:hypothetical protein
LLCSQILQLLFLLPLYLLVREFFDIVIEAFES